VRGRSVFPSISAKLVCDATLRGDLRLNGIIVRDRQEDILCFFGADPLWRRTVLVTWSMRRAVRRSMRMSMRRPMRRSVRRSMRRMVRIMRMTMWGTMMISMLVAVLVMMAMLVMMSVLVVVFAFMLSVV